MTNDNINVGMHNNVPSLYNVIDTYSRNHKNTMVSFEYRTRAIITRGLYTFYPLFQKRLTKLAIFPDYKHHQIYIALWLCQKLGMILLSKVVSKLKLPKNHFSKKCATKFLFFIEKSIQKDLGDF